MAAAQKPHHEPHKEYDEYDFLARKNMMYPTFLDKVWVWLLLACSPAYSLVCLPGYFSSNHKHLGKYLLSNFGKFFLKNTSLEQLRYVMPPKPLRIELNNKMLKPIGAKHEGYNRYFPVQGASARWLHEVPGRKPEDPVVLYLHGGAYFIGALPPQIIWCLWFARKFKEQRLSVLAVDYTVSPNAMYPTQLNETVACYKQLGKSCDRIIVMGDSAGGHLAASLQLWCHENQYPKPFGVILISVWAELMPRYTGSYADHKHHDYLHLDDLPALRFCTLEQTEDPHSNPNRGDAEFWRGVFGPNTVSVWGQNEILKDTCVEFTRKAGITDTFEQPKGVHDVMVIGYHNATSDHIAASTSRWLGASVPVRAKPSL